MTKSGLWATLLHVVAHTRKAGRIQNPASIYSWCVAVGILSGLGAVAFSWCLAFCETLTFTILMGVRRFHPAGDVAIPWEPQSPASSLLIVLIPTVGGLLAGLLITRLCPAAGGTGTEALIKAFHFGEGRVSPLTSLYKCVATLVTLGTGGSAGKEGPASQIGAGLGSGIAGLLKSGARARRTLMLAGAAGGLGAIFQAPLAGAVTAIEVMYKEDVETDALIPCVISSVTSYIIFTILTGSRSIFHISPIIPDYQFMLLCLPVGAACFAFGWLFRRSFNSMRDFFDAIRIPAFAKPAVGGLAVGLIGLGAPSVMGTGLGWIQHMFDGGGPWAQGLPPVGYDGALCLMGLGLLKMLATSLTVASGGSGGIMGPSLFMGAMTGASVGCLAKSIFPEWDIPLNAFTLIGMGGFFAGVCSAPIAGVVMVCDMSGSYSLLLPLMIVCGFAIMLSRGQSIYRGQLANRFDSPAHHWDMNWAILDTMPIADHLPRLPLHAVVTGDTPISTLGEHIGRAKATTFVVRDKHGAYMGVIDIGKLGDLSSYTESNTTAGSMCDSSIPAIRLADSLGDALRIIGEKDVDKLAVVDDSRIVVGHLRPSDILRVYYGTARHAQKKTVSE